jgi:hypothetical protein
LVRSAVGQLGALRSPDDRSVGNVVAGEGSKDEEGYLDECRVADDEEDHLPPADWP